MTPPKSRKTGARMATLDVLRLVAALAVVCFHYLFRGEIAVDGHGLDYPFVSSAAMYGYLGVNQFFLISGFVIAWSAEGRDFARFSVARFARLYPGFLTCMAITFAVLFLLPTAALPVSLSQFAANLIMFSPALGQPFMDGVYWSIILEIIFYGWVAVALFFGVFERWKIGLLTGWLVICAANEFWLGSRALQLLFVTEYGPLFVSGVLLHHIYAHGRSTENLALLAASFIMSTATMLSGREWMLDNYGLAVPLGGLLAANVTIYALMIAAIGLRTRLAPSSLVLMLGGLTYPLYLLHQNIGYVALGKISPALGNWGAFAVVTAVMLLASWAIWRFVETPARKAITKRLTPVADTISRRISRKPAVLAAE